MMWLFGAEDEVGYIDGKDMSLTYKARGKGNAVILGQNVRIRGITWVISLS